MVQLSAFATCLCVVESLFGDYERHTIKEKLLVVHYPQFPVRLKRIVVENPFQKASLKVKFLGCVLSRGNLRNLAFATGISVSTLSRAKSRGVILKQSKTLKPNLTVQNKESWLKFVLNYVREMQIRERYEMSNMENTVFVDEKWFLLSKINQKYTYCPARVAHIVLRRASTLYLKWRFLLQSVDQDTISQRKKSLMGR